MAASPADIEEFLAGPLVTWLATCIKKPESLQVYDTFFDGGPFSEILLQIDPEPSHPVPSQSNLQGLNITAARIKIFHSIIKNIKTIYEEELGQIVISLPDCVAIGRAPASELALRQLKLLVLLILGCAVQGPTKERFITKIKALPVDAQHDIVECIKQVTDDQSIVLTLDWTEQTPQRLYSHVRTLTSERDKLLQQWMVDLSHDTSTVPNGPTTNQGSNNCNATEGVESNHLAVELADWKARLRKQRQELEEKSELLTECKEELTHANCLLAKLKAENCDLLAEARRAKAYRDELDAMRERAERADRLEAEATRFRERLVDAEFYKVRVDELREDNRVLLETREMLESQLARARQRADHVLELEAELMTSKQTINDVILERDAAKIKIQDLIDENFQLQHVTKSALQETNSSFASIESDPESSNNSGDNSLSEQLTNSAQARALKLELENKKLLSAIDALKERNFHENANKLLELEKDKKKLTIKSDQLQLNCERLTQQNGELENLFKNAIQENRKLQDSLDTLKIISDRQAQDLQSERSKIAELEKNIDSLNKDKERLQVLCDTIKKRADDSEKSALTMTGRLESLETRVEEGKLLEKINDALKEKVAILEKESGGMAKEVARLKEMIETKDVTLDLQVEKNAKFEKEIQNLTKDKLDVVTQLEKLQEYEKRTQELISQASVHSETIAALQKDLIAEKINNEKFRNSLEKLGLSLDVLDNDINIIVEKMVTNDEISKSLTAMFNGIEKQENVGCKKCTDDKDSPRRSSSISVNGERNIEAPSNEGQMEKLTTDMTAMQHHNATLQNENAKMQVDISTLKSQVHSLQTQQTALQLANSQLVAEKEDLSKEIKLRNSQHDTMLLDQVTIRTLHEQLNLEYEELKKDRETLKKSNRDLKLETRSWKEKASSLENIISALEHEKQSTKEDARNLTNLKAEHCKLKDDFRSLFTATERLKIEYRTVQDELKSLRNESRTLRLGHTEMQGELSCRTDLVAGYQLENAKLQQKCDMLYEMNSTLDSDRRALMDHVSQLLAQYHTLLTHSLEDKEHYHLEEKMFADKLNNLCRQKEKLEEKIMEHYKKLDNATSKKRGGFGATLVRRVRKAGSDIISKVPRSNRRSWQEDTTNKQTLPPPPLVALAGSGESNGSNGNESDNSMEEPVHRIVEPFRRSTTGSLHGHRPRDEVALRRSHRDMAAHRNSIASEQLYARQDNNSALTLGAVGTRRTVYIAEEETTPPTPVVTTPISSPNANHVTVPSTCHVYNRLVSANVSANDTLRTLGNQTSLPEAEPTTTKENSGGGGLGEKKKTSDNTKEAVWYEYGCV